MPQRHAKTSKRPESHAKGKKQSLGVTAKNDDLAVRAALDVLTCAALITEPISDNDGVFSDCRAFALNQTARDWFPELANANGMVSLGTVFKHSTASELIKLLARIMDSGQSVQDVLAIDTGDGTKTYRIDGAPLNEQQIVIAIIDAPIEAQRQAIEDTANERIDKIRKTNKELLATINHDLRTPLNTIIGFAQMMEEELLGPIGTPQYREYATMIGRSGRGMLERFDEQVAQERFSGISASEDYEHIIELAPDMICICRDGLIDRMNAAGAAMLGVWNTDTLIDRPFGDYVHEDYKVLASDNMAALMDEKALVPMKLLRGDEQIVDVEISAMPYDPDDEGDHNAVILMARDVTERHRNLSKALDREEQLRKTMDTVADGIVMTDTLGNIESVNAAGERIFGYLPSELIGKNFSTMLSHDTGGSANTDVKNMLLIGEDPQAMGVMREFEGVRKDGQKFPLEIAINEMTVGGRKLFISSIHDISERKQHERQLRKLATCDPLTGLPNRYLFEQNLDEAIAQVDSTGESFAILSVDLNSFANINEAFGHVFGDSVIRAVGQRLEDCLGGAGMVAHFGGDDFYILISSNADMDTLESIAAFICSEVAKPLQIDHVEIFTSCTIGICLYPDNAKDRVELMQHADTVTHFAKSADPGSFVFYAEHQSEQAQRRLDIDRNLRRAIERNELHLLYQPKVDLRTRAVVACEALLRWENAELGFVSPDEFIGVAERSGLIIDIGQWVMEEACRQGRQWLDEDLPPVHIAINLSAVQFLQGDLEDRIKGALEQHNFNAASLDLELTESMLVENPEKTIEMLESMKKLGATVSMDDFGTGYSSLSFLARLPLDNLKVDRAFVMNLPEDRDAMALVRAIITMAQQLGLSVIAEGIETQSQETFLSALGCEMGQGYYYGKPMPPSDFADLVRKGL